MSRDTHRKREGTEMTAKDRKQHIVEVHMNGFRYQASELRATITISRDGNQLGKAKWHDDQLVNSTATLPDDVFLALEKKLKERMDANWDED
jgi:hypothetical protein